MFLQPWTNFRYANSHEYGPRDPKFVAYSWTIDEGCPILANKISDDEDWEDQGWEENCRSNKTICSTKKKKKSLLPLPRAAWLLEGVEQDISKNSWDNTYKYGKWLIFSKNKGPLYYQSDRHHFKQVTWERNGHNSHAIIIYSAVFIPFSIRSC